MSERSGSQANQFDRKNGLGVLKLQKSEDSPWLKRGRSEQRGPDSALSKLREFREQRESTEGYQAGSSTERGRSSRTNLGITHRIAQSPFGLDQPMFQRHRTAASQLREIKQIARDGSIITKMCHAPTYRQDNSYVTRSRAGSGSSSIFNESVAKMRQKITKEIDERTKLSEEKENEKSDSDDFQISLASRLRRQRVARSDRSLEQQTPVEKKLLQARKLMGRFEEGCLSTEKSVDKSSLRETPVEDANTSGPIIGQDVKEGIAEAEHAEAKNCEGAADRNKIEEGLNGNLSAATTNDDSSFESNAKQESEVKDEPESRSEETSKHQGHSFERSRLIASRIFEKLESKKGIERATKVGIMCEMESKTCVSSTLEAVSTDLEEKSEQSSGYEDHKTVLKQKLKRDSFEVKLTKARPINIHGFNYKDSIAETKDSKNLGSEELETEGINVKEIGAVVEMSLKDSLPKLAPPDAHPKRSPTVAPKPSPPVPQAHSPETAIVLGSGEKIRVAVQLPDEEGYNEEGETEERGESSIEEPTQQSVATLRNSLFGGSASSLEKMLSRGMGGTLSASPVVLRKKQVTERRQVVSNVEVTKNGVTSMSVTQAYRLERRSESDATRNAEEAGLLPTLYTRFEKPKKPGSASKARKSGLEPITFSVKLSDDVID